MSNLIGKTYCNTMSMPDCPRGTDAVWSEAFTRRTIPDYRSIGDPSVLYYHNKWYLFPSYEIVYVTEDFVTWKHIPVYLTDGSPLTGLSYSPGVCEWKGRILLCGHSNPLYVADAPEGPYEKLGLFKKPDGTEFSAIDPALFRDDNGSIYLYYFDTVEMDKEPGFLTRTLGAKLCDDDPSQLETEPVELNRFCPEHQWECFGEYNQDNNLGWIEGQWMIKRNGRYYLIYSGAGAELTSYAQGVYYSDEGPLSGFTYQPNNPLTYNKIGLVKGPGHGCVVDGPDHTLWTFYSVSVCYAHHFERRIGMDQVLVDENGYLYCPRISATPQFAPGTEQAKECNTDTGLYPLFYRQCNTTRVSSWKEGRDQLYAMDESMLTWWQPEDDDTAPEFLVYLQGLRRCEAARVVWREVGLDYDNGIVPAPFKYVIEGAQNEDGPWEMLLDESQNEVEECIAYRAFEPKNVRYVRLRILDWAKGIHPGVTDFMVFGKNAL